MQPNHSWRLASFLGTFLTLCTSLRAQALVSWSSSFDASQIESGDTAFGFAYDGASGRAYSCGWSQLASAPDAYGAFVAAFDADGATAWSLLVDQPATHHHFFYRVAPHPAGGVVAVGERSTLDFHDTDALLWRIDASGAVVWSVVWDGPQHSLDRFQDVDVDAAGAIHVAGMTWGPPGHSGGQGIALEFDAAGNEVWSIVPEPTLVVVGSSIERLSGGDLAFSCGSSVSRITSSGAVAWTTPLTFFGGAFTGGVADDVLVVGNEPPPVGSIQNGPLLVQRIDSTGQVAWTTPIFDAEHPSGFGGAITVLPTGRIVAAGLWSDSFFFGREAQGVVASLDALGNVQWVHPTTTLTNAAVEITSLAAAPNGDVVAQGSSLDTRALFLTRIGPDGGRVWVTSPAIPLPPVLGGPTSVGVAVGSANEVYSGTTRVGATPPESDALVIRIDSAVVRFCFGDGALAACPCSNESGETSASGCRHSFGLGAQLFANGSTSLAMDTLELFATGMPTSSSLFFQGSTASAGNVLGDGLSCTGGALVRLGVHANTPGGAAFFPGPGDLAVSLRGGITSPGERIYQTWYRNAQPFCTSATFNLTNAVRVRWVP
ncbi:MAG: hypothetical protein ACKVWV_00580 [Planctomycetota bacterium]